jgi:hypothetical protein
MFAVMAKSEKKAAPSKPPKRHAREKCADLDERAAVGRPQE